MTPYLETLLGGLDGSDITTGATADDGDVVGTSLGGEVTDADEVAAGGVGRAGVGEGAEKVSGLWGLVMRSEEPESLCMLRVVRRSTQQGRAGVKGIRTRGARTNMVVGMLKEWVVRREVWWTGNDNICLVGGWRLSGCITL